MRRLERRGWAGAAAVGHLFPRILVAARLPGDAADRAGDCVAGGHPAPARRSIQIGSKIGLKAIDRFRNVTLTDDGTHQGRRRVRSRAAG